MKPSNVIICQCDQLRAFELGCYGNGFVRTPNLDAFAAKGVRFDVAVANQPVCMPSRASLLSGQYARTCTDSVLPRHAAPLQRGCFEDVEDWPQPGRRWFPDATFAELMREHGYATALIGKWHVDAHPASLGFDYALYPSFFHRYYGRSYRENDGKPFVIEGFSPDFELAALERYLAGRDEAQPLFLYLNFELPHMPLGRGNLPKHYQDMYCPDKVPLRDNVRIDGRLAHDQSWFTIYTVWNYWAPEATAGALPEGFDLRDLTAAYLAATTCTDDLFGRMLEILHDAGVMNDAIVIFTSDHGDQLGSHHLFNKDRLFEESIRIPLLLRAPGIAPGVDRTHVASTIDVLPTVLDFCGLPIPQHIQGTSLATVLSGEAVPGIGEVAFIETSQSEIGIRTLDRLVGMSATDDLETCDDDRSCAYDLVSDPLQFHNVASDPAAQAWQRELRARLLEWDQSTPLMNGRQVSRSWRRKKYDDDTG
jgi:arylsulfatase A-like enzyme